MQALLRRRRRQRAGRARHRRQDRRRADQHLWRRRDAARQHRRDQAAQAPRGARDQCRARPHLEAARDARRKCRSSCRSTRWRASRSTAGALFPFLKAMEFVTIAKRLGALLEADPSRRTPIRSSPPSPPRRRLRQRRPRRGPRRAARGRGHAPEHAAGAPRRRMHEKMQAIPLDHANTRSSATPRISSRWIDEITARASSPPTPRPPGSTTRSPTSSASRSRPRRAMAPTCRSATPRAKATSSAAATPRARWTMREALELLKPRLRRPLDPEDLPQRQIRPRHPRPLRHRGPLDRRQPAPQLFARRPAVQHHGRALGDHWLGPPACRSRT